MSHVQEQVHYMNQNVAWEQTQEMHMAQTCTSDTKDSGAKKATREL